MSTVKNFAVLCDVCRPASRTRPKPTEYEARNEATELGWRTCNGQGPTLLDVCPECIAILKSWPDDDGKSAEVDS